MGEAQPTFRHQAVEHFKLRWRFFSWMLAGYGIIAVFALVDTSLGDRPGWLVLHIAVMAMFVVSVTYVLAKGLREAIHQLKQPWP